MARPAGRFPASLDGAALLLQLARRRHLGAHQCRAGGPRPRIARPQRDALGRHHRQPERADDGKRRPARDRRGQAHQEPAPAKAGGRKRHIVTDTEGFLLALRVHEANIQDPHGAVPLLHDLRRRLPTLQHIFADRVYRGAQLQAAIADCGPWTIQIVERPAGAKGFQLLPKRWVVERSFAWLGRCRRLAKDFEATIASAAAWVLIANVRLLIRRLARTRSRQSNTVMPK